MIRLTDVTKRFPGTRSDAVSGLSLDIPEGELVALIGPSGCGKTTTLKMINRLVEPTSGSIEVAGRDVTKQPIVDLRRNIGYVIQNVGLMPHRRVRENVSTVPRLLGWDAKKIGQRVAELAELFELGDQLLDRYPVELSGGQRQRVGVARALAADPPVMLMDEPFGAVDPIVRGRLQDQFLRIQERLQKTIVLVTHDIDEAVKMSDRIAILNVGGLKEQYATPAEILRSPANDFVSSFVGAERGLKRLSLVRVGSVEPQEGPTVPYDSSASRAAAAIASSDHDWASVLEDGRLLGWVDEAALEGHDRVAEATIRPFLTRITPDHTLREALDAVVTSRTAVAALVDDDERYLGILTLEHISEEIVS